MKVLFFILLSVFLFANNYLLYSQDDFYSNTKNQEIKISFKESNWKQILDSLFQTGDGSGKLMCNISINGQFFRNAGIRYKGFSSWNANETKNPFNIELDYSIKNQNYMGYSSLKLSNVIYDPSFLREVLSYSIARKYMPAPKANYANVYVNDTLIGLYTNVESVDEHFIDKNFTSYKNTFFKGNPESLVYPFGQNSNLAYTHGTDTSGYMPFYSLESDYGWTNILKLIYTLNNDTANIPSVLNIDQTLWMHAFNYSLLNLDSYIGYSQNYYMYQDDNELFNPIIWDLNMSFGSFRHSDGSNHFQGLSINQTINLDPLQHLTFSISPRPLMKNLFKNATYKRMYLAHIRTIINENFKNNNYYFFAQELHNLIESDVLADTNKFYSYADYINNIDINVGTSGSVDEYPGIKYLMDSRIAYLDKLSGIQGAPVISQINYTPESLSIGSNLNISANITGAAKAFLFYRFKSSNVFSKITMQQNNTINNIFQAQIQVAGNIIQYYIYAENDSAGIFSPERAAHEYYTIQPIVEKGNLVINEIQASDNQKKWIELYNNTYENINLKNIYLSNNIETPIKWAFPDTSIASRNFLVVWAENDTLESGLQANFTLSESGGNLYLSYANYTLDSIAYAQQINGKSTGRYPNGYGSFDFMTPTFSKYNHFGTSPDFGFIIYPNPTNNEIYIQTNNSNSSFSIEIFNSNSELLISKQINNQTNSSTIHEINISSLYSGVYYMKIFSNNSVFTKKIIVLN